MKTWKIFFTAGLAILTAAAVISCDKAGDDWQPTWAVPLVKKQMLTIADFMDTTTVRQFNDQVRVEWNSYVDDKFGLGDSTSVDAAAFAAIASMNEDSSAYAYIAFEGNTPQLNDSTRQLVADRLTEQGVSEDSIQKRIEEVNNFLELYWKVTHPQLPQPPAGGANVLSLKGAPSRHVAAKSSDPASGSYTGGGGALNHLLDAMIHPTDVFVTAANVLSVMGDDYLAKVGDQLDEVLKQATVNNYTAVSFKEMVKSGSEGSSPIRYLEIHLGIASTLPFTVTLTSDFVKAADHDTINVATLLHQQLGEGQLNTPIIIKDADLDNIALNSTGVVVKMDCSRGGAPVNEQMLRTLSNKGFSLSLRVRMQAQMNGMNL